MLEYQKESDETPDYDSVNYPELPRGWQWSGGVIAEDYYTANFGTTYRMGGPHAGEGRRLGGFDGMVYWDSGNSHTVEIVPIVGIENDDPVLDYPDVVETYPTMQAAVNGIPELIEGL